MTHHTCYSILYSEYLLIFLQYPQPLLHVSSQCGKLWWAHDANALNIYTKPDLRSESHHGNVNSQGSERQQSQHGHMSPLSPVLITLTLSLIQIVKSIKRGL